MSNPVDYLLFRVDTYLVLVLGVLCMASVAKWGLFRGKVGDIVELSYSIVWPLSFPFWAGFAYLDGIGLVISTYIALAYGTGFAVGALRRSQAKAIRAVAGVSLAINLLFCVTVVTITWTTRYF